MGSYGHSGDRMLVPVAVAGFLRSGRGWLTTLPAVAFVGILSLFSAYLHLLIGKIVFCSFCSPFRTGLHAHRYTPHDLP